MTGQPMTTPDVEAAVERLSWQAVAEPSNIVVYAPDIRTLLASHAALVERPAVSVEDGPLLVELAATLLTARFTGWEDRDAGDEWKGDEALAECRTEATRIIELFKGKA